MDRYRPKHIFHSITVTVVKYVGLLMEEPLSYKITERLHSSDTLR